MNCYNKQSGVASIIFIGLLPILLAMMCFAIYIAQETLEHTKALEASEVAITAVAISPKDTDEENEQYAALIISKYTGIQSDKVLADVNSVDCHLGNGCYESEKEQSPFSDYSITSTSTHKAWIKNKDYNMGSEFTVSTRSSVRKSRQLPSDTYFIFDWANNEKYDTKTRKVAIDTIKKIAQEYSHTFWGEENFFSFVPYEASVVLDFTCGTGYEKFEDELSMTCLDPVNIDGFTWPRRLIYDYSLKYDVNDIATGLFYPYVIYTGGTSSNNAEYNNNFINEYAYYRPIYPTSNVDEFISNIENLGTGKKRDGTYFSKPYNGLIGTARFADAVSDSNRRPMQHFILFTYGRDQTTKNVSFEALGRAGLCNVIKTEIERRGNSYTEKTKITLDVIGLEPSQDYLKIYEDCFGKEHVFVYDPSDELSLYNKLSEIMSGSIPPILMY